MCAQQALSQWTHSSGPVSYETVSHLVQAGFKLNCPAEEDLVLLIPDSIPTVLALKA